ncbi:MAG: hypothetical protein J6U64_05275 [Alphaproteobacteria bacterium]|nr:hypothetical protein [Alphaproteobacteria bacterium]
MDSLFIILLPCLIFTFVAISLFVLFSVLYFLGYLDLEFIFLPLCLLICWVIFALNPINHCSSCDLYGSSDYCTECGSFIGNPVCPSCGFEFSDQSFCPDCGFNLIN